MYNNCWSLIILITYSILSLFLVPFWPHKGSILMLRYIFCLYSCRSYIVSMHIFLILCKRYLTCFLLFILPCALRTIHDAMWTSSLPFPAAAWGVCMTLDISSLSECLQLPATHRTLRWTSLPPVGWVWGFPLGLMHRNGIARSRDMYVDTSFASVFPDRPWE